MLSHLDGKLKHCVELLSSDGKFTRYFTESVTCWTFWSFVDEKVGFARKLMKSKALWFEDSKEN